MIPIILGTAQWSGDYGVVREINSFNQKQAQKIISTAREVGIDKIDTAAGYGAGSVEKLLGASSAQNMQLISKLPMLLEPKLDIKKWARDSVSIMLQRLKQHQLNTLLLHNPEDILSEDGPSILSELLSMKSDGLISKLGISVYNPSQANNLLELCDFDCIQIPYSVFDQRPTYNNWLDQMNDRGIDVHLRSVFLQGLLARDKEEIPSYFIENWGNLFTKWWDYCDMVHASPKEVAITFARQEFRAQGVVVGFENAQQLKQVASIDLEINSEDLKEFSCSDNLLIEPFRWRM